MKLINYLLAIYQASLIIALTVSKAKISVNDKVIEYGEISTLEIKTLPIESTKDQIDFEIYLDDIASQPHQMLITLGNGQGLDFPVFPKYNVGKKALKLSLTASKLPLNIRNLDKILIKLIISDGNHGNNLIKNLGEFIPSSEFQSLIRYQPSERIGIKPVINHIFKSDAATVNPIYPIIFIGFNIVAFLTLLGLWSVNVGNQIFGNLKNIESLQLLNNASFLTCILGYEYVFIKYYLGQSIFQTLFHAFLLSIPSIVLGSRTFRWLAKLRKIGRA